MKRFDIIFILSIIAGLTAAFGFGFLYGQHTTKIDNCIEQTDKVLWEINEIYERWEPGYHIFDDADKPTQLSYKEYTNGISAYDGLEDDLYFNFYGWDTNCSFYIYPNYNITTGEEAEVMMRSFNALIEFYSNQVDITKDPNFV